MRLNRLSPYRCGARRSNFVCEVFRPRFVNELQAIRSVQSIHTEIPIFSKISGSLYMTGMSEFRDEEDCRNAVLFSCPVRIDFSPESGMIIPVAIVL